MDRFMAAALAEARAGFEEGGAPIGSVLVKDGTVLGRGRNRLYQTGDPTTHAEMEAIRDAARALAAEHPPDALDGLLAGATVYTTMMPCAMCAGAIVRFGLARVVVGEIRSYRPAATEAAMRAAGIAVETGDEDACVALVEAYLARHPERRDATVTDRPRNPS